MYIVMVDINKDLDSTMGVVHRFEVECFLCMVFHGMGNHGDMCKHSFQLVSSRKFPAQA